MGGKATRMRVYRQLAADPADRRHGTYYAYCCGCRCARCTEAMRAYHRIAPGKAGRATREREPWGLWELRVMRLNWGEEPVEEIARMLRREPGTVAEKGRAIGLDRMVGRRMRGE